MIAARSIYFNLALKTGGWEICTASLLKLLQDLILSVLKIAKCFRSIRKTWKYYIRWFLKWNAISGSCCRMHSMRHNIGYYIPSANLQLNDTRISSANTRRLNKEFLTIILLPSLELLPKA